MSRKMLIEATHPEETRVVVLDEQRLEELDVETSTKKQLKGNIYLAKIVRVEPSLQAAFVDYGGNRHGFLAFNEIHPDYYQIPVADREALKKELMESKTEEEEPVQPPVEAVEDEEEVAQEVETVSESETDDVYRPRFHALRKYKIQEVIHHNQIVLVQITKEERGNKGAALTTYLSLAGRYSVLMPNNANGGGVSRKIANAADRRKLKTIVESLPVPEGMSVIIRTAGRERTKTEIKRDYDYLIKTWMQIRDKTLESKAPSLIHEEGNLIKRTLRDAFSDEITEVLIEGEAAYKSTRAFVRLLMPRQVKKIKQYKEDVPLFQAYGIENQLEEMNNKNVYLKSGGYLVIDQAEALVAIDVNSGRATRERNIEETALKTNLEAADEVARQLRLRDLAGLIVIDFIDMDEMRNNHAVERRMKEALKKDRARVQMSRLSGFGLMEISRQRLHSSFLETGHHTCPMCQGTGIVRSVESCAMHALRVLEDAGMQHPSSELTITLPLQVAMYVLNAKRTHLGQIEARHDVSIKVEGDGSMQSPTDFRLERVSKNGGEKVITAATTENLAEIKDNRRRKDKRRRDRSRRDPASNSEQSMRVASENSEKTQKTVVDAPSENTDGEENTALGAPQPQETMKNRSRRRHPRDRFRRDRRDRQDTPMTSGEDKFTVVHQEAMVLYDSHKAVQKAEPKEITVIEEKPQAVVAVQTETTDPKPVRRPRKKKETQMASTNAPASSETTDNETPPPKKGGWWNKLMS